MSRPAPRMLDVSALPAVSIGTGSLLWWGVVGMLVIEASVLAMLVVVYFYLRLQQETWPPAGVPPPALAWSIAGLVLLVASVWPMQRSEAATHEGDRKRAMLWLGLGTAMGLAFLTIRVHEWQALPFRWDSHPYGSIVWVLFAFHTLHLGTELLESLVVEALLALGWWGDEQRIAVVGAGPYWMFVVAMWIALWSVLYLVPRL